MHADLFVVEGTTCKLLPLLSRLFILTRMHSPVEGMCNEITLMSKTEE